MKQNLPSCPPRTAVAYARYSSAGQRDVSIEQQLADIRAFADREGYTIVHEYADHARSGFRHIENRAAFHAMMSAVDSGSFDTVLVWKVDRFGRSREDSAVYKGRLRRRGVKVVYVMEPIPDGSAGILLEGMLEATAEWYSVNLSENVRRGLQDNARQCLYNGAHIYGYGVGSDSRYSIIPEQAAVVRHIYSLYLSGNSVSGVARLLNDSGIRNARGNPWTISQIYHILQQERYTGVYIYGDFRIDGGMPVILDRSTWEAVGKMLGKSVKKHTTGAVDFLLTGKAFCGHCGKPMVGDSGTGKSGVSFYYYSCQSKKRRAGCDKKSVRKETLENAVLDFIFNNCLTESSMEEIASAVLDAQQSRLEKSPLGQMEKDLADLDRRIANTNRAISQGIFVASTLDMLHELTSSRDQLAASILKLRGSSGLLFDHDMIMSFLRRLAACRRDDPEHRKRIIKTFVHSVTVYDDHLDLRINAFPGAPQIPFIPDSPDDPLCSDTISSSLLYQHYPNTLSFQIAL